MFDSVSILFSDVVTFTEICSRITPMEVVSLLNYMYSIFDTLTERNNVYKVETIGDAYMVVSGAPEKEINHAEKVCDMALDMVEAITDLKDPSTGSHLRIRVGVHSGAVVAGIVGLKMPRYCLFGDSVNTASRMESTSEAMKIHISESTKELLGPTYRVSERGEIDVKGKGAMKTYWLDERENRPPIQPIRPSSDLENPKPIVPSGNGLETRRLSIASLSKKKSSVQGILSTPPDERRIYSPVTFRDVARRSIANSPVRSVLSGSIKGRESRSNSTGHVFMRSPSDVFGSLISDTEEFLEDLQLNRGSINNNMYMPSTPSSPGLSPTPPFRIGTAPTKPRPIKPGQYTEEEMAVLGQQSPPPSAPNLHERNNSAHETFIKKR